MAEVLGLLLGFALGAWQTRRLRQEALRILLRASASEPARSEWALYYGFARRLLPPALLLGLLLAWSPLAAVIALAGFWLGRTFVLARDLRHFGSEV